MSNLSKQTQKIAHTRLSKAFVRPETNNKVSHMAGGNRTDGMDAATYSQDWYRV